MHSHVAIAEEQSESGRPFQIDWHIDLGHVLTFLVLLLGFAVQYGSLSTRLSKVEEQSAKATAANETLVMTLRSLEVTIIRVQTQMDEREKRFAEAQAEQNLWQDKRDLHEVGRTR